MRLNDKERRRWVEGLMVADKEWPYRPWIESGESLSAWVRHNRESIDRHINKILNK